MDKLINKLTLQKAVEESARLQLIQLIVWDYMSKPKLERDGIIMAMEISKLFEDKKKNNY